MPTACAHSLPTSAQGWPRDCGHWGYLLFRAPADFGAKLRRHGAVVRGCGNYPGLDETWYRTAVRAQKENEQLLKIMREVLA